MLNKFLENIKRESFAIALLIAVVIFYFHFSLPKYHFYNYTKEMDWDVLSYYLYLPLVFLHHDLGIKDYSYIQHLFDQYHFSTSFYQAAQAGNGNYVLIYTSGLAILESPFFLIGHLWAKAAGYPTDGFSFPYQFCVSTGMMFYLFTGLFITRKILLRFFSERVSSVVLILLFLGTNYFHEATNYNLGPHAILFTLYSFLIYYTIKWHENPQIKYAVIVGIAIGFVTLIRPTELICILIPLFWNVSDKKSFYDKIALLKSNKLHLLFLFIAVVLVGLPQMIYWKTLTGSFLYNSYWNQQSFDITESHLIKILFSFRKGWLLYTPMIGFAFIGAFFLKRSPNLIKARLSIFLFILFNIFLISHVPIWWNAGSFGQRFMVQSYAILALPLGAFVQFFSERKIITKFIIGTICSFMIFLNIFQTWQIAHWIIPGDGITAAFYKKTFLQTANVTPEEQSLLEIQRSFDPNQKFNDGDLSYRRRTIGYFNMDDINTEYVEPYYLDTLHVRSGRYSFRASPESAFSPSLVIPYDQITKKDHAWIRFTVWFFPTCDMKGAAADVVIHFSHRNKPYQYCGYHIGDAPYELNKWNKMTVDYLTPDPFSENDEMHAYVWFKGTKSLLIDDIQIEAFEKK